MAAPSLGGAVSEPALGDENGQGGDAAAGARLGGWLLHALLLAGALVPLAGSDRADEHLARALGDRDPWLALALGVGVGVALALLLAAARPWLPGLRRVEGELQPMFASRGDAAIALFVALGALAEESMFRLALPAWIGAPAAVAAAAGVNSWAVGWRWLPLGLAHATAFVLMVDAGFGLLATATAGAVANYLMIRSLPCRSRP